MCSALPPPAVIPAGSQATRAADPFGVMRMGSMGPRLPVLGWAVYMVFHVVGEILPSLIRLGTVVSYHIHSYYPAVGGDCLRLGLDEAGWAWLV